MVQIWAMDPYMYGDCRLPHHIYPPRRFNADELMKMTGTLYYKLDLDDPIALSKRIAIMKLERKFKREDIYTLDAQATSDFFEKLHSKVQLAELYAESITSEDQAKMVLEGQAYYDVEARDGSWVRILCEYGDLIIIPAGRPYRMATTGKNFVKVRRFFKEEQEN